MFWRSKDPPSDPSGWPTNFDLMNFDVGSRTGHVESRSSFFSMNYKETSADKVPLLSLDEKYEAHVNTNQKPGR